MLQLDVNDKKSGGSKTKGAFFRAPFASFIIHSLCTGLLMHTRGPSTLC